MVAFNFKAQFADAVQRGEKTMTIRAKRKDGRVPKEGDKLQLYTGMRQRGCRKLADAVCHDVCAVRIERNCMWTFHPQEIHQGDDLEKWAKADGFASWKEMADWFDKAHGLPFTGILIRWLKPVAAS